MSSHISVHDLTGLRGDSMALFAYVGNPQVATYRPGKPIRVDARARISSATLSFVPILVAAIHAQPQVVYSAHSLIRASHATTFRLTGIANAANLRFIPTRRAGESRTALGKTLRAHRARALAAGMRMLSDEEIDREVFGREQRDA